ncbi:MAG: ROK family protein [Acidobacteria bacterium]|nr:ROK family protein [Acidobacteriota bacterium]
MDPKAKVLTLDAGGTGFAFSVIREGVEIIAPFTLPSMGHDLGASLAQIEAGFSRARVEAGGADAISVAFPGPADYANGVIGDLGNLPGYRGGVPLRAMLEARFGLPVLVNNDADLFALGEARHGRMKEVNADLESAGSPFRHRNLVGVTLGTGFGAGLVAEGRLLRGDNGSGGSIWLLRAKDHPGCFAEEAVSIRGLRRAYAEASRIAFDEAPDPKNLADRARSGDAAAREAFRRFGEAAGDALASALTLMDGLAVLGGGLSGAADLFMPALMAELNSTLAKRSGGPVPRLESRAFNLEDALDRAAFLDPAPRKRTGVCVTRLGTARATALGAWEAAMEAR